LQKKDEPQQFKNTPKKQSQSVNDLLGLGNMLKYTSYISVQPQYRPLMLKLSFPDALAPQAPVSNGKQSTEISPALDLFTSLPAAASSSNSARSTVKTFIEFSLQS